MTASKPSVLELLVALICLTVSKLMRTPDLVWGFPHRTEENQNSSLPKNVIPDGTVGSCASTSILRYNIGLPIKTHCYTAADLSTHKCTKRPVTWYQNLHGYRSHSFACLCASIGSYFSKRVAYIKCDLALIWGMDSAHIHVCKIQV